MKRITLLSAVVLTLALMTRAQVKYDNHFFNKTLRIDYYHIGDAASELITLDEVYEYDGWAGSKKNLIDPFNNGAYYYKVYDIPSGTVLFSRGFDSYFKEYQTTTKAIQGTKRTYHESALVPMPKRAFRFSIEKRDRSGGMNEVFADTIDPSNLYIIKETPKHSGVKVSRTRISGDPATSLDLVILGDGYSAAEQKKFERDLKRYADVFLSHEPFKRYKNKINIYGVFHPSEESGIDEPGANMYKRNLLGTRFYSLGSERYILTEENKVMRDLAGHVPYDAVYIMCNSPRYGGGGIYNLYSTFTSDNQFSGYVFLHEFGHSFAGLADEYYTSDVAYNEFYPEGVEPAEPNLTRLMDPMNLKWKHLQTPGIQLPTLWNKEEYDGMDVAWQKERRELNNRIAELKRSKAPEREIAALQAEYAKKDKERSQRADRFLETSPLAGKVGAFEGSGYASKGLYRPMVDCLMFTKGIKPFCRVCEEHMEMVIRHFTE
ncbi:MAG: peptidase M64 [Ignavibacteria bacterium]|nr:peptidase M64 [Ignavibacteria bacterium]